MAALPLFALGFRPLYLLAGAYAAVSILYWAALVAGLVPAGALAANPLWHAHEMIFGFTLAVIVGFLFTAGRNWSGQPTPTGGRLAALALVWIAARVLAFTPWASAAAAANILFALGAALGLGLALWRGGNRRNYFFVALLVAIGVVEAVFQLALAGAIELAPRRMLGIALDVVLFICAVMAGRVVPMFTNNGVPGAGASRNAWVERVALGSILALTLADILSLAEPVILAIALVAAITHGARLYLWNPWATRRKPIVWILHAAYAWVVVHLALRAAGAAGLVSSSLAVHALTVGVVGGLTLGMMTRTSRGHTGRPLVTGRVENAAYVLVMAAALARVGLPLAAPAATSLAIVVSGALWSAAFALFTLAYWPILSRPRLDGLPG